jgi:ferrochelatase
MLEVAEHYQHFGGVSPINGQNRELIAALEKELAEHGPHLPIYWGNRNWYPMLTETMEQMKNDGVRRAIAFFTSAFSSYSGCRQYRENIQQSQQAVGEGAPQVEKLRVFFNHPGYVEVMAERLGEALAAIPAERRAATAILYTAHSIPLAMSDNCRYVAQLNECCRLVGEMTGRPDGELVYQSRSGPPTQPWLEPDVCDYIRELKQTRDVRDVILVPIGFISDHMEVLYDLDTEAADLCHTLGIDLQRAGTAGTHPRFVRMIRELIEERMSEDPERAALGEMGPSHDVCPVDCCLSGRPVGRPT